MSYSKKRRKRALSPRSLTESSAENVHFPLGHLLKAPQKTCTFPSVPYWKLRRKRALSPRSLTESSEGNVHFPLGPLLKAQRETCTFPSVPYWKLRRKRALSPRSLTESSEGNVHFPLGPLLKAQKETCTFPSVPYWKHRRERGLPAWCLRRLVRASAHYIEQKLWKRRLWNMISFALLAITLFRFLWVSRFGVIAVYRCTCHEYRKHQLNPALCFRLSDARVRTILYFKLNTAGQEGPLMLAWIRDIYR